jgi:large subunit ribosomal protein L3
MQGILGKKLGMTQVFDEDGSVVPVTVVQAGPCVVVQRKTSETDGYDAVQLGLVEEIAPRYVTKPRRGHFARAGAAPTRRLAEFPIGDLAGGQEATPVEVGDEIGASIFAVDEFVDVTATSKGKGFQGVVRRHGFRGGRATHGSMFHRAPGSVGQSSDPSRVYPGVRLPGQMGAKRVTTRNVRIVRVEADKNLLFLKGPVPGPTNGYVAIRRAKRG